MTSFAIYALGAVTLFAIGLQGLIACRRLVRKVIAFNIAGSGVFLLLVSFGARNPTDVADPVPHAMVLTGIVVAFAATAFALALVQRIHSATGLAVLDQGDPGER